MEYLQSKWGFQLFLGMASGLFLPSRSQQVNFRLGKAAVSVECCPVVMAFKTYCCLQGVILKLQCSPSSPNSFLLRNWFSNFRRSFHKQKMELFQRKVASYSWTGTSLQILTSKILNSDNLQINTGQSQSKWNRHHSSAVSQATSSPDSPGMVKFVSILVHVGRLCWAALAQLPEL